MKYFPNIKKFDEISIYRIKLPKPIPVELYEEVFEKGILRKSELVNGKYYIGKSRNTDVAMWDGDKFIYMRSKFGHFFKDDINHFEDDNGYDLFIPLKEIIPQDYQIIK